MISPLQLNHLFIRPHQVILLFGLNLQILLITGAQEATLPIEPNQLEDASTNALISEREDVTIIQDSDVAEAVSRRPDLQFNNVTIDGEKSNVSLGDIPADAINELEVLRAVTPDVDADSRGGSLNLSSNPTFNLEQPVFKADLGYTYSQKEDSWEQESSITYGRAVKNFGFRFTVSQGNIHNISEENYVEWEKVEGNETRFTPSFLNHYITDTSRKSHSLNGSIDYKISDSFYVFFRHNLNNFNTTNSQPHLTYKFYKGAYSNVSTESGTRSGVQVDRDFTGWENEFENIEYQVGGIFENEDFKLDFRFVTETKHYIEPDWTVIQFRSTDLNLDYTLNNQSVPVLTGQTLQQVDDTSNFVFDEYLSERWTDDNDQQTATINSKYKFEIGEVSAYIKTGIKLIQRKKDQYSDSRIYTQNQSQFSLNRIATPTGWESLLVDGLQYGSYPTLPSSREFLANTVSSDWYDLKRSAQKGHPATYLANEDIKSAYMMFNLNYQQFRTIIGLRSEKTALDYRANEVEINSDGTYVGTRKRTGSNSYKNLFPSVHLRYFLGRKMTIIGSWTSTIKRPFYGDIVPYRFINYDAQSIKEGNPSLNPTIYDNIDLSLDYKLSESSLLSLEVFNKEVEDIVYWEVTNIESGVYKGFEIGRNENGPSASENGIRLILTQSLDEWWDALDGLSLILKITFQDTETEYPVRPDEMLPVTYRPDRILEATITYDKGPFFAQLQYSRNSRELQSVYSEKWQDIHQDGRHVLDLSSSYQINDKLRIFADISNILKEQSFNFYGHPNRPSTTLWKPRRFQFGLKFSI